jgi:hypothetical protein
MVAKQPARIAAQNFKSIQIQEQGNQFKNRFETMSDVKSFLSRWCSDCMR